jgi:hypothetical protein
MHPESSLTRDLYVELRQYIIVLWYTARNPTLDALYTMCRLLDCSLYDVVALLPRITRSICANLDRRGLARFRSLRSLRGTQSFVVTGEDLMRLPTLRKLTLERKTVIMGRDLMCLASLTRVGGDFRDANLHLLPSLTRLSVWYSSAPRDAHLAQMTRLTDLSLYNTDNTNAHLRYQCSSTGESYASDYLSEPH